MKFQFWWTFIFSDILFQVKKNLGDISVFVTFEFWWYLGFGDISVWDISVLGPFQFQWHFSFGDVSVLVTFEFDNILVLVTILFWWHFRRLTFVPVYYQQIYYIYLCNSSFVWLLKYVKSDTFLWGASTILKRFFMDGLLRICILSNNEKKLQKKVYIIYITN